MHRIDSPNASSGVFVAGNPVTGQRPTVCTADWFNAIQEEIAGVVTGAGIELSKTQNNQLLAAILVLIQKNIPDINQLKKDIISDLRLCTIDGNTECDPVTGSLLNFADRVDGGTE